jgi:hypothetical protein
MIYSASYNYIQQHARLLAQLGNPEWALIEPIPQGYAPCRITAPQHLFDAFNRGELTIYGYAEGYISQRLSQVNPVSIGTELDRHMIVGNAETGFCLRHVLAYWLHIKAGILPRALDKFENNYTLSVEIKTLVQQSVYLLGNNPVKKETKPALCETKAPSAETIRPECEQLSLFG